MRLKLDLHPIYNDSRKIEQALADIVAEAIRIRATEVEIIPGKGSGALKKTVIRFLERPEIKASLHRVEKDSDNWGRLFVHFRHERPTGTAPRVVSQTATVACPCACCGVPTPLPEPDDGVSVERFTCAGCGSPNRARLRRRAGGAWVVDSELAYDEAS